MANEIPPAHRDAMKMANEAGYFPTPAQAKEISLQCASLWGARYPGRKGAIPDDLYNSVLREAIEAFYANKSASPPRLA